MQLRVLLPTEILIDEPVLRIVAEAQNGSFCLLPRHVRFVAAVVPGILRYVSATGREHCAGVGQGILIKQGREVLISTQYGAVGTDADQLEEDVRRHFDTLNQRERQAATAVARMEADFVRRFLAVGERPHA